MISSFENLAWPRPSGPEGSPHILRKGSWLARPSSLSLLLSCLVFALLPAALAQAFEDPRLADLDRSGQLETLAESRAWLRFGEWHKGVRGWVSDADGPGFFVSPNGKRDPQDELRATLRAFAEPFSPEDVSRDHAQCRFPARRRFLFDTLELQKRGFAHHPCLAVEEWKKKLDAEAVSLVFASAYMNNAASMFGHTFLRFHSRGNKDGRELLDYGVSFFANTGSDGGVPFALYGLTGGYRGHFSLAPYHETLKEYANLEGRDVFEYELALSPADVEVLVERLLELEQTHFDYWFLDENCSYRLLAAIEAVRPDLNLLDRFLFDVIPADAVRVIGSTSGLVRSIRYLPSHATTFRASVAPLDSRERSWVWQLSRASEVDFDSLRSKLDEELPVPSRARIVDAALHFTDVSGAKAPESVAERAFRLRTWRASLAVASEAPAVTPPSRPEQGHDPAFLTAGAGQRAGRSFQDAQFRFAYHDLLSDAAGYLDNTQLEVLRFRFRQYEGLSAIRLEELQILDLISLQPSDEFFRPPAWRARLGIQRLADRPLEDELAYSLSGGPGFAIEPLEGRLLLFAFAQLHGEASRDLERGHRLGASAQVQALLRPLKKVRLQTGLEQRNDFSGDVATRSSVWARSGLTLSRNLEARAAWERHGDVSEQRFELVAFFLL